MAGRVEISVVVENNIDIFLPSVPSAEYPVPGPASRLLAEQGLSLWIDVEGGGKVTKILYDFGRSDSTFFHNLEILGLDLSEVDLLVLSHGHVDHSAALLPVLERTRDDCRLFINRGAVGQKRYVGLRDGRYVGPWEIKKEDLDCYGGRIVFTHDSPLRLLPDLCVSGEIERRTDFEKGMPNAFIEEGSAFVHDPIRDDQALFIDLDGRGIVVITGCCHSGLVNTLIKARESFPGKGIYAVAGGLHLNDASERQMEKTVEYLSGIGISHIAALHCTGHHAKRILAERFKDKEIPGTTGARITFLGTSEER